MSEDEEIVGPFYTMPTELLLDIFFYLPAQKLMRCREVCVRWKLIIDSMAKDEGLWTKFCREEYEDNYWFARKKAARKLSWYNLYRSLTLWSKLDEAEEENDEFASAYKIFEEVRSVEVIPMGTVGVHRKRVIEYYDVNTYKLSTDGPISGEFARYAENDSVIVIQSYHLHLYVIRKFDNDAQTTILKVKLFLLTDTELYYVKLNNEIYVCDVYGKDRVAGTFINCSEDIDAVMALGYTDCLNVLTFQHKIYTVKNNKNLIFVKTIKSKDNIIDLLHKYNLLEQLDWRVYFQWMSALNHTLPEGPLRDIIKMRSYGDVFFVGTNSGVLSIFYKPYIDGKIDIFNTVPIRQINFVPPEDLPILSICPILQIDILEIENGHKIFVAMPKRVAVLKYIHPVSKVAPWTVKPYDMHELLYV